MLKCREARGGSVVWGVIKEWDRDWGEMRTYAARRSDEFSGGLNGTVPAWGEMGRYGEMWGDDR